MSDVCPHCGQAVERASDLPDLAAGIGSAPAESLEGCEEFVHAATTDGMVSVRLTHPSGKARTGTGLTYALGRADAERRMRLALAESKPGASFFAEPLPRSRRFRVEPGRDRSA